MRILAHLNAFGLFQIEVVGYCCGRSIQSIPNKTAADSILSISLPGEKILIFRSTGSQATAQIMLTPGNLLAGGAASNILPRDITVSSSGFRDFTVDFEFGVEIPLAAGQRYWLAIPMQSDFSRVSVFWDYQGSTVGHASRSGGVLINDVPNFLDGPFAGAAALARHSGFVAEQLRNHKEDGPSGKSFRCLARIAFTDRGRRIVNGKQPGHLTATSVSICLTSRAPRTADG